MILSAEQLHGLIASIRDRQIAIVEAVGARAVSLQLTPGEQVQAEVIARLPSGQSLANIAGQTFSLPLPAEVKPGETVRLTYLSGEPRLTFAISQSERQGTPTTVSDTARWLGKITRDQSLPAAPLPRPAQLLTAPPTDPRLIAAQLRQVVTNSGLFYEAHLAEWAAGERPLTGVLQEPQGTLSQPAAFVKAGATGIAMPTMPQTPVEPQGRPPGATATGAENPAPAAGLPSGAAQSPAPDRPVTTASAPLLAPPPGATAAGATVAAKTVGMASATAAPDSLPQNPPAPAASGQATAGPATTAAPAALPVPAAAAQPPTTTAPPTTPAPTGGTLSPPMTETVRPAGAELPTAAPTRPQAAAPTAQEQTAPTQQREAAEPRPLAPGTAAVRPAIEPLQPDQSGRASASATLSGTGRSPAGEQAQSGVQATEPADPRTIPLIRDQLELLQSRTFSWQGEGWPGQPIEWRVEEREPSPGDATQRAWTSTLHLDLPHLGEVHAGIQLLGKSLQITINGKLVTSVQELRAAAQKLRDQYEASGLQLTSLEVQHE